MIQEFAHRSSFLPKRDQSLSFSAFSQSFNEVRARDHEEIAKHRVVILVRGEVVETVEHIVGFATRRPNLQVNLRGKGLEPHMRIEADNFNAEMWEKQAALLNYLPAILATTASVI